MKDHLSDRQREELEKLLDIHRNSLYMYALKCTKNPEDAGDVLSEALIRIYGAYDKFNGKAAFRTWCYRIVRNCFLDSVKGAKKRWQNNLTSLDAMEIENSDGSSVLIDSCLGRPNTMDKDLNDKEVVRFLESICPDGEPRTLLALLGEEETYADIAKILQVPAGTVKSRIHRLRNLLQGQYEAATAPA